MLYLGYFALLVVLLTIHELGFLATARLMGLPIARFSFGIGPKLWAWRRGETEYKLRAIPGPSFLMPALTREEWDEIPWKRKLVFFLGGPLAKLLLALTLYVLLIGIQGIGRAPTSLESGLKDAITLSVAFAFIPIPTGWKTWARRQRYSYRDRRLEYLPEDQAAFQAIVFPEGQRPGLSGLGAIHELPRDSRAAEPAGRHP